MRERIKNTNPLAVTCMILIALVLASCEQNRTSKEPVSSHGETLAGVSGAEPVRDCSFCPEMVLIPAGKFMMGDASAGNDALPLHEVIMDRPFFVGRFEVTQAEWQAIMRRDRSRYLGRAMPVHNVSWLDVQNYLDKLSDRTGRKYRLLTEAEWEYVARAGTSTAYFYGETIETSEANFLADRPKRVGSYLPNAFGVYDMHGNLKEWVQDCFTTDYSTSPTDGSADTNGNCEARILRGGSYSGLARFVTSAVRHRAYAFHRHGSRGFRIARDIE